MLKLTILNKPKELLLKCKTKFPDVILANLQEKEITPTKSIQEITPDSAYDGLSKVTIDKIPDEYIIPKISTKTVTKNGTYKASDENLDGYSEVDVATSGVDINDYFGDTIGPGYSSYSGLNKIIKRIPSDITVGNDMKYAFYQCSSLLEIPLIDTSNVTNMSYAFNYCSSLKTIPLLNTSNVTDMSVAFESCSKLESVPLLDLSKVTNMTATFRGCSKLKNIPLFNTHNVTSMSNTFLRCGFTTFPQLDTSNATSVTQMLASCSSLTTVPLLNAEKMSSGIYCIFQYDWNLTDLGGLENLGKAYLTTQNANYYDYKLDLSNSQSLTHDSLMNVINNLYDIATAGVQVQQLVLGSTNVAKLTADEIAIATNKGWTVS